MPDQPSLRQCLDAFIEDRRSRDYSPGTLAGCHKDILVFIEWAWRRDVLWPVQIDNALVQAYQDYLLAYRRRNGRALSKATRQTYLARLRTWLRWLVNYGVLAACPAAIDELPVVSKHLPHVLSESEVYHLLQAIDLQVPFGLRDRAMLETLYGTGMRGLEAVRLRLEDLDLSSGWVMIRQGKNRQDRRVPLGDSAVAWVGRYLRDERPRQRGAQVEDVVFLTHLGQPFKRSGLSALVRRRVRQAGIDTPGGTHLLRHSVATHLLNRGADIRFIQCLLGHADLSSTQIYTRVQDPALKRVHQVTHPGVRMGEVKSSHTQETTPSVPD